MEWAGSLCGLSAPIVQRLLVAEAAASVVLQGQIICSAADDGVAGDPADVNTYTGAFGISLSPDITVSATQGASGQLVETTVDPFAIIRGIASGGTAAGTAHTSATLLTNDTASAGGLKVTDAEVADLDYVGGYLIGLTGDNAGAVRVVATQTDSTSTSVVHAFDNAIAVGDTLIRTYAPGIQGIELTTNFVEFNNLLATGEALDTTSIGQAACVGVRSSGQPIEQTHGVRNPYANIISTTNPTIELDVVLVDHAYNSLA